MLGTNPKEVYAFAETNPGSVPNVSRFKEAFQGVHMNESRRTFSSPAGELRVRHSGTAAAKLWPHLRFVVLLRDPIARAIGWFNMCVRQRLAFGYSVEGLLELELDVLEEQLKAALTPRQYAAFLRDGAVHELAWCLKWHTPRACVLLPESATLRLMQTHPLSSLVLDGIYVEQLLHWLDAYERNRFLIIRSEELFAEPAAVIHQIEAFVGVEHYKYHASVLEAPVSVWPDQLQEKAEKTVNMLPPQTRARAERFFNPWNARLAFLVNLTWDYHRNS